MSGKPKRGKGSGIDKKGRSKYGPPHVRLHLWLLQTPAYRSLKMASRCALVELYQRYKGTNNGYISFSVREMAKRLDVAVNTAKKAIDELEEKGLIRVNERGAFTLKVRHATTWILTEFEHDGQRPTKDFMSWRPSAEIQKPVSKFDTDGINICDRGHEDGL